MHIKDFHRSPDKKRRGQEGAESAKIYKLLTILLIPSLSIGTLKFINIPGFKFD